MSFAAVKNSIQSLAHLKKKNSESPEKKFTFPSIFYIKKKLMISNL